MSRFNEFLYPRLRTLPAAERQAVLERARKTPFDVIELVGMALGLVLATAATRYDVADWTGWERTAAAVANYMVALPLLVVLVGPFLIRRVRRGLDRELERR